MVRTHALYLKASFNKRKSMTTFGGITRVIILSFKCSRKLQFASPSKKSPLKSSNSHFSLLCYKRQIFSSAYALYLSNRSVSKSAEPLLEPRPSTCL
jgi:hypothetical protein